MKLHKKYQKTWLLFFCLALLMYGNLKSQKSLEFTIAPGATAINIENLVYADEIAGSYATDWGVFNMGISAQYFFASKNAVSFGAEVMQHYLYWYSVAVPYGFSTIYREYSVSSLRLTPMVRFNITGNFDFDIGPELNFINGISPGVMASANYNIKVSDKITVPLKFRMDIISHIVVLVPVSLNAGVRVNLY